MSACIGGVLVFLPIGFPQRLSRGNQFWVELGFPLLYIPCLDSDIFGLGFGVFAVACGYAS